MPYFDLKKGVKMKQFSRAWEQISGATYRMETPQGWLVSDSVGAETDGEPTGTALCFVPDPKKDWKLSN